eukprot:scaffold306719_cov33-Tisochrysis_lutea.AAC.6
MACLGLSVLPRPRRGHIARLGRSVLSRLGRGPSAWSTACTAAAKRTPAPTSHRVGICACTTGAFSGTLWDTWS